MFASTELAGKTDLEQAKADMIVDCVDDLTKPMIEFKFEADEAKKVDDIRLFRFLKSRLLMC